ncbi:FRG domain-containing protein [Paenibacillus terrigena]|uniref:FRG domain-containing protein n=1 Tax=Paenibacillus terrigena TaxID=369333 RepID=UPI0028D43257|nr:FRG domain-containing protein [Paenibacillus terrigena]
MAYSNKWIDILNLVEDFRKTRGFVWFRGHSNIDFHLNSGLFRDPKPLDVLLKNEVSMYRQFKNLGNLYHNEVGWNLLYIMQHHGVKTRLLDWSESFTTALFFAYSNWQPHEKDACIWLLCPSYLNSVATGDQAFFHPDSGNDYEDFIYTNTLSFNLSVSLYPIRTTNRMNAQQGVFTLQGNSQLPLELEYNGNLVDTRNLLKISLTMDLFYDVRNFLLVSGVNYYNLFPDLDGLAKHVNDPLLIPTLSGV